MDLMFDIDGRLALAESDHTAPYLLAQSADGKIQSYAYRGYRFKITRDHVGWWCYEGVGQPGELTSMCHEAGWFTWRRTRIVRKLARAVDRRERQRGRALEVA